MPPYKMRVEAWTSTEWRSPIRVGGETVQGFESAP